MNFCRAGSLFFCAECLSWLGTVKHGKAALKYLSFFSFFSDQSGLRDGAEAFFEVSENIIDMLGADGQADRVLANALVKQLLL